jgi:pimeloyl-ACP methyl ester carboxylesterase
MSIILIAFSVGAGVAALVAGLVLFTALNARRAQAASPPVGRFIEVAGVRLHYLDRGMGPAVVLVHGLAGNLRNFYELTDRLASSCRVIAVDRPGSGYSKVLSGGHLALRAQAAIIARFIAELRLDRPILVGHSLGGALALALARDHPDSVRALVLISSLSQLETRAPAIFRALEIRSAALRWLVAWTLMAPLGKLAHRASLEALFAPEPVPPRFDAESGGGLALRPRNFIAASKDMVTVADEIAAMIPSYPRLTISVQVIFGRQDPILDYRTHGERLAAALPNSRLHLIDGGHMIPVTAADQLASWIVQAAQAGGNSS